VAAGQQSGLPVFLGSYPITPASDILHELSKHKAFGVTTFQAEDEISGIGSAIGASFGGALGVTTTSGPGISLKSEAAGLAVALELPLLIIDVQRGGPSTGLPTKTEQSDLLQAMFGRNGESPLPIIAPRSPGDCFDAALEAPARGHLPHPVMILSDGSLANGSEPWKVPDVDSLPHIEPKFATGRTPPTSPVSSGPTCATTTRWPARGRCRAPRGWSTGSAAWRRPTARAHLLRPGEPRADGRLRQAKIDGIPVPDLEIDDPDGDAELLVLGWGSTYGPIGAGCRRVRGDGLFHRPGPPAAPQPVPGQPWRRAAPLQDGARGRR